MSNAVPRWVLFVTISLFSSLALAGNGAPSTYTVTPPPGWQIETQHVEQLSSGFKAFTAVNTESYSDGDKVIVSFVYGEIKPYHGSASTFVAGFRKGMGQSVNETLTKDGELVATQHSQTDTNIVETQLRTALDSQDTIHLVVGVCTLQQGFKTASAELCRSSLLTLRLAISADQRKSAKAEDSGQSLSEKIGFMVGIMLGVLIIFWILRKRASH
jgi:hypothetical protein